MDVGKSLVEKKAQMGHRVWCEGAVGTLGCRASKALRRLILRVQGSQLLCFSPLLPVVFVSFGSHGELLGASSGLPKTLRGLMLRVQALNFFVLIPFLGVFFFFGGGGEPWGASGSLLELLGASRGSQKFSGGPN